jgi:hypothetical protein
MEFYTEFLQVTSLEPSIYKLTENLILFKFELWRVTSRRSLSCVRMIFCDRLSRIAQFFPKQDLIRTACWASGRSRLSLISASEKETRNILEHWVASERVTTSSGRLAEPSQIVSSEILLRVKLILMLDSCFSHAMKNCVLSKAPLRYIFSLWLLASENSNERDFFC